MAASTEFWRALQIGVFGLGLTLGLAAPTAAQVVLMSPLGDGYDWEYRFRFESGYQTQSEIQDGGAFDALRFKATGSVRGPISHTARLYLDVAYAHTRYSFAQGPAGACSDPRACFSNAPWQDVHTLDIAPGGSLILADAIRIQAFVPIRWHAESHSDRGGVTAGLVTEVRVRFSESLTASLGVGVQSELEEAASVFPVIALDWRPTDGIRLVTRGDPYQGGDVALLLGNDQPFRVTVSAGFERRRFRLSDRAPDANGVGEMTSVPLLVGFRLETGRGSRLSIEGGVAVRGRLELDDAHGRSLRRDSFDTAGLIRGALRVSF